MAASEQLTIEARSDGDRVILVLTGELDMATAPRLRAAVEEAETAGKPMLVFDLQQLNFIDSTGLRTVLWAHERCEQGGRTLSLTPGSPQVQRLLAISGAAEHLHIIATAGA